MHGAQVRTGALAQLDYEQTRPENTTLYQVVAQHVETLFAQAELHGSGYPVHVKREFERFLRCKQYCCGFARLRCSSCDYERIVPFSCKGRAVCPSCIARRMADAAAHLVDHVLPDCGYRLWTLSLPWRIRLPVVRDAALLSKVVSCLVRTISAYQRRRARALGIVGAQTGAVTFVQLWGSVLQLTPHCHTWVPEGVFTKDPDGTLVFHPLPPPSDADVAQLTERIARRVRKLFDDDIAFDDDDDPQLAAQAEAVQVPLYSIPFDDSEPPPTRRRCAMAGGFSLHADVDIEAHRREKLEQLLRYAMRPPFAARRLSWTSTGKVRLRLRKPFLCLPPPKAPGYRKSPGGGWGRQGPGTPASATSSSSRSIFCGASPQPFPGPANI